MSNPRVHLEAVRALHELIGTRETKRIVIPAKMGNGAGVVPVPNNPNYVYVRLFGDDNRVQPALNLSVAPANNIAVEVEEVRGAHGTFRYVVIGLVEAIAAAGGPGTAAWWLTVREVSGGVIVVPTTTIRVPNGSLTDNGSGVVSLSLPSSPHDLLDGVQDSDTLAGAVVLGDLIHGNATPKWARLGGQTTTVRKFLRQTGTGTVSAVPSWDTLVDGDIPATLTRTSRLINTTAPITGGGDLSADRTLALANTAVTPGTYGDASNVPQVTIDAQGRITAAANVAITGSTGGDVGHEHGLDRYAASSAQTVFDLTSYASQIELCSDNGSIIDPQTYTLSADGSQVTMDSGITAAHVVTVNYILVAI